MVQVIPEHKYALSWLTIQTFQMLNGKDLVKIAQHHTRLLVDGIDEEERSICLNSQGLF
jgi:hypothetical protein